MHVLDNNDLCGGKECFDEVLFSIYNPQVRDLNQYTGSVLHQQGSLGPAYYKRVPEKISDFQPECTSLIANSSSKHSHEILTHSMPGF